MLFSMRVLARNSDEQSSPTEAAAPADIPAISREANGRDYLGVAQAEGIAARRRQFSSRAYVTVD